MNRTLIAATIYSMNADTNRPLLLEAEAKNAFQAADVFVKYAEKEEKQHLDKLYTNKDQEVIVCLIAHKQADHKIHAIKQVRNEYGCGLKEAKDIVDHWWATGVLDTEIFKK